MTRPLVPDNLSFIKRKNNSPFQRLEFSTKTPYEKGHEIKLDDPSIGKETKTCPVDSLDITIFRPEWYHGD